MASGMGKLLSAYNHLPEASTTKHNTRKKTTMTSLRTFCFTTLFWMTFLMMSFHLYSRQNADSAVVAEVTAWFNGLSTASSAYGAYGGSQESTLINAPDASAVKTSYTFENEVYTKNTATVNTNMPDWTRKFPFMLSAEAVDDDDRICYVHIGKTAGSTMACALGFEYDSCPTDNIRLPNGNLGQFTTNMIHKSFNDCKDKFMDRYLFVVRDPLARMQSWFTYERPTKNQRIYSKRHYEVKKMLFLDCPFHSINDLGGSLGLGGNNSTTCSKRAWRAVTGEQGFASHNKYNFAYYYNEVLQQNSNPKISVIRTEHLEDDWRSVEVGVLNGPRPFSNNFTFSQRHTSKKNPEDLILSEKSQINLCSALCHEIQVYKRILQLAENLSDDDYDISMAELRARCPVQEASSTC